MDAHRKRHLNQDHLTLGNKREGAYECCLDLIASQNTSEIVKFRKGGLRYHTGSLAFAYPAPDAPADSSRGAQPITPAAGLYSNMG